jgi:hypothetical protein
LKYQLTLGETGKAMTHRPAHNEEKTPDPKAWGKPGNGTRQEETIKNMEHAAQHHCAAPEPRLAAVTLLDAASAQAGTSTTPPANLIRLIAA